MELLIFLLVAITLAWLIMRKKSSTPKRSSSNTEPSKANDYEVWLNIIKDRKSNVKEFALFGTKAAVLWNDGEDEAEIICITAFRNGEPITKKWDHFTFKLKEAYWLGPQPKGASEKIREELKGMGLTQGHA